MYNALCKNGHDTDAITNVIINRIQQLQAMSRLIELLSITIEGSTAVMLLKSNNQVDDPQVQTLSTFAGDWQLLY